MVQRKNTKTGPKAIRSLLIRQESPAIQINKTLELRTDLKTVEPSYTSAAHQLKSRIAGKRSFWPINYGGGQTVLHRLTQNVFVDAPRRARYR